MGLSPTVPKWNMLVRLLGIPRPRSVYKVACLLGTPTAPFFLNPCHIFR